MKKTNEGKIALINFLEAVEEDKLAKKGPSNAEKLGEACKTNKEVVEPGEDEPREMDEAAFSRQHYESIARILKNDAQPGVDAETLVQDIAEDLADLFAQDNPNFDREKFLKAAGI